MQDEITKHGKKAVESIKNTKHSFATKVKEVAIEIFIIVFAVTFSIWLHDWNERKHQQKEVKEFLQDLKVDMKNDSEYVKMYKSWFDTIVPVHAVLGNLDSLKMDSILKNGGSINFASQPIMRKSYNGNYESFKSSGKLGFIENKELKQTIVQYYQVQMTGLSQFEESYNQELMNSKKLILDNQALKGRKGLLDKRIKMEINNLVQLENNLLRVYDETFKFQHEIRTNIEEELTRK